MPVAVIASWPIALLSLGIGAFPATRLALPSGLGGVSGFATLTYRNNLLPRTA
jgi:hypothetical protein